MLKSLKAAFLLIFIALLLGAGEVWGQCGSCNVTIANNGAATDTPATLADGDVICITANNRTRAINLRNKNNLTICVASGGMFSGGFNNYTSTNRITVNVYGEFRGNLTLDNSLSSFNIYSGGQYNTSGSLTVTNGMITNQGYSSRPVTLTNSSTYTNSGTQTSTLTINGNGIVTNSGSLNLTSLIFDTNSSGMSFTNTLNSSLTVSSSVTASGTLNIQGNANFLQNLTLKTNNGLTSLALSGNGNLVVGNTFDVAANSQVNITNTENLSPAPTLTANSLNFSNDGGLSPRQFNVGANTAVRVLDVATLQSGNSQLTIEGSFETGINVTDCKNTLIVSNNGGATPTRIQVRGEGNLDVTGSVSISKHVTAKDKGTLNVSCNLVLENNGDNSLTVSDNVKLAVGGNTTLSKPMYVNGNATINLSGNLTLPNVASELVINDNSFFYVGGDTSVESPIRMNDGVTVTFDGNINLPNVGNAQIWTDDNADVLVTGNMTKSGGTVNILKGSQLVFCNARLPVGNVSGQYPTSSSSGMSISPSPAYYGGCRILPIDFSYFQIGYIDSRKISQLSWSTAKEWQNSHFEIERAVNSVANWETIGSVDGAGYSDTPLYYTFDDDRLPASGGNIFYRLKQVNLDGTFSYSVTRAIKIEPIEGTTTWIAFPNPSNGDNIQITPRDRSMLSEQSPIHVLLFNSLGQAENIPGSTLEQINQNLQKTLSQRSSGVYLIQIIHGNDMETLRIIKI